MAMRNTSRKKEKLYTYGDYLTWPEDERWELIEGVPYDMTPTPGRLHQEILREIAGKFIPFFTGKPCRMYFAPFDVRLPKKKEADEDVFTVVQPDLVVICDPAKLDDRGCRGAPDLAVEILSPSTTSKDQVLKLDLYEKHGVKEYWVVHPVDGIVMIFSLAQKARYGRPQIFSREQKIASGLFPELTFELKDVFKDESGRK